MNFLPFQSLARFVLLHIHQSTGEAGGVHLLHERYTDADGGVLAVPHEGECNLLALFIAGCGHGLHPGENPKSACQNQGGRQYGGESLPHSFYMK